MTDEVKSIGLLSPTAQCGHTALRGLVSRPHAADYREFSAFDEIQPLRHGFAVPPPLKWRRYVFRVLFRRKLNGAE